MKTHMTVRLELKPDVEASLTAQARSKGVALGVYLQSILEDLARSKAAPPALSSQDLRATLDALAEMGRDLPNLTSDALSRESIYCNHD